MDSNLLNANPAAQNAPPENFAETVKVCLANIYDLSFLQANPLMISPEKSIAGQDLRLELNQAIEALNPGANFSFVSREARMYRLLHLHYIQKMGMEEIASALGISLRQAYRDLRASEDNLAAIVWEQNIKSIQKNAGVSDASEPDLELSRIDPAFRSNDLVDIVQNAIRTMKSLSVQQATPIHLTAPAEPLYVLLQETIANQVLVSLLSYAVRQAYPGTVIDVKISDDENVSIDVCYMFSADIEKQQMISDLVVQLIHRLNWQLEINRGEGNFQCVRIKTSRLKTRILIIDDNEGLVGLMSRYLADQAYNVYSTLKASEGLRLAKEILPDVIILDVMMPGLDGWELLQRLKIDPQTRHIHIIICSVFKEPELAKSLGASAFLPKPIRQPELLAAIQQFSPR